jgi:hypothetical protein
MPAQHARAGIAHYILDFLTHLNAVAVHNTSVARRFLFLKWAILEPSGCVCIEFPALRAQLVPFPMQFPAVEPDHCLDRASFSGDSRFDHFSENVDRTRNAHMSVPFLSRAFLLLGCPPQMNEIALRVRFAQIDDL